MLYGRPPDPIPPYILRRGVASEPGSLQEGGGAGAGAFTTLALPQLTTTTLQNTTVTDAKVKHTFSLSSSNSSLEAVLATLEEAGVYGRGET